MNVYLKILSRLTKLQLLFYAILMLGNLNAQIPKSLAAHADEGLVYDISIERKDVLVSGLFVINKLDSAIQVDIIAKMGTTLMEGQITKDGLRWKKTIAALSKRRRAITELEKSIILLTQTNLIWPRKVKQKNDTDFIVKSKGIKARYKLNESGERILEIRERGWLKPMKRSLNLTYENGDAVPSRIDLNHQFLNFEIKLNKIDQ